MCPLGQQGNAESRVERHRTVRPTMTGRQNLDQKKRGKKRKKPRKRWSVTDPHHQSGESKFNSGQTCFGERGVPRWEFILPGASFLIKLFTTTKLLLQHFYSFLKEFSSHTITNLFDIFVRFFFFVFFFVLVLLFCYSLMLPFAHSCLCVFRWRNWFFILRFYLFNPWKKKKKKTK